MKRHVGAAALARFREGDLGQRRAARVGAHLTRCARCTDLSAELAGITMLLASTPVPAMPDHLAARIQDTLASEAAGRLALDQGTEPARRELPRHGGPPRRRRPVLASPVVLRTLAAAGAIVVIGGGGYLALSHVATGTSGASSAAGHPAAAAGSAGSRAASQPFRAAPSFGPALSYGHNGASRASFVPVATGLNFVPAALAAQVTAVLSQVRYKVPEAAPTSGTVPSPAATSQAGSSAGSSAGSRFAGIPLTVLDGCVSRIAAGGRVLLVDVAKYQGRPATVIVVAPGASAPRQVWVVGPACSASRGDVIAHQSMPGR
jgi:hypothetical protein